MHTHAYVYAHTLASTYKHVIVTLYNTMLSTHSRTHASAYAYYDALCTWRAYTVCDIGYTR